MQENSLTEDTGRAYPPTTGKRLFFFRWCGLHSLVKVENEGTRMQIVILLVWPFGSDRCCREYQIPHGCFTLWALMFKMETLGQLLSWTSTLNGANRNSLNLSGGMQKRRLLAIVLKSKSFVFYDQIEGWAGHKALDSKNLHVIDELISNDQSTIWISSPWLPWHEQRNAN